ncbi:MAG TPA: hypothetical protein PKE51_09350, partial [Gemmatimonadaceae bacterium]|nr:hypothetical protein [Gemmatimonadaceae bacterium]
MPSLRRLRAWPTRERAARARTATGRAARVGACLLATASWSGAARDLEAQSRRPPADSVRITLALRGVPLAAALEQLVAASGI